MEKILKYKAIVRALAEEIGKLSNASKEIETQIIIDDEHGHYLLFSTGWKNNNRTYGPFVHLDVTEDGKVWLQHDGTNLIIADLLEEKGIPKEDIVLAFHAPFRRPLTGYAVS